MVKMGITVTKNEWNRIAVRLKQHLPLVWKNSDTDISVSLLEEPKDKAG